MMFKSILLSLSLLISIQAFSQDHSEWIGPNRDGIYPENSLLKIWPKEGLQKIWQFDSLGIGFTSASIVNETIYTSGVIDSIGYIYALDINGKLKWKYPYGQEWKVNYPGSRTTPVIYGNLGYILSGLGVLYCFNIKNGENKWTVDLFKDYDGKQVMFGITENLLIYKNMLICTPGGINDNVIALDCETGKLVWKSKGLGEPSAYNTPIIINHNKKDFLIVTTAKSVMSLNPETGVFIWGSDLNYPAGIHGNAPIYKNGYLFTQNGWDYGSVMLKIDESGNSAQHVWRSKCFDIEHGNVVVLDGNIYGSDHATKQFFCVDWKTGVTKDSIKELAPCSVISADGLIYCYAYNGELALIKPKANGFEIISRFRTPFGLKNDHIAFPVISKGKLYVRYANHLIVYNIKIE